MDKEEARRAASVAYGEGLQAFDSGDYATAEPKLTAALDANILNPDFYCFATVRRAVCWAAAGKATEAVAELDKLGMAAPNQDEILAARSFIFKKQGNVAASRAALAKARLLNKQIKEFK
jgi:predicted Zn-dependent protease